MNITLIAFNRMEDSKFKGDFGWINHYSSPFYKEKLKKICCHLQVLGAKNGLVVPECFKWYEEDVQIETIKGMFGGVSEKKTALYSICLYFKQELTEEQYLQWALILRGVKIGLLPNID